MDDARRELSRAVVEGHMPPGYANLLMSGPPLVLKPPASAKVPKSAE
jgi:hypothetical protein